MPDIVVCGLAPSGHVSVPASSGLSQSLLNNPGSLFGINVVQPP